MDENKQEQMVSIIVPVYNAEAYLPEMIESVIFQNYNNWELLLIDKWIIASKSANHMKRKMYEYELCKKQKKVRRQSEIMVCWLPTVAI